jgi:hypothetical protein
MPPRKPKRSPEEQLAYNRERARKWRMKNPERFKYHNRNSAMKRNKDIESRWRRCQSNAKNRNREFTISFVQFKDLSEQPCYMCGSPGDPYHGLDRFDNTKGYTPDNCRSCCYTCNSFKSDFTYEETLNHIKKIYQHNNKPLT